MTIFIENINGFEQSLIDIIVITCLNRLVLASGLFAKEAHAEAKHDLNKIFGNFMAEPITPKNVLEDESKEMRVKMEMLIMRIQV